MTLRFCFAAAIACAFIGNAAASRQVGTVTIDGSNADIAPSTSVVQDMATGFGPGEVTLYNFRMSNDATNLYLGISSKFDAVNGTKGLWIFIDSKSGGQNVISTSAIGSLPQGAKDLTGTVLEAGFNADYLYFLQNGNAGSRPSYYLNVIDLQAQTETYYGEFHLTNATFTPGTPPSGFAADVDNSEAAAHPAAANTATKGFEFQIPLAALGTSDSGANTVNLLVGSGDGSNGYWSNQTLPTSSSTGNLGGGNSNGSSPNFATNTYGAFGGSGTGFAGIQMQQMALPVAVSAFSAE